MNRLATSIQLLSAVAIGSMLGVSDANAQYDYTYDVLGRVTKVRESATSKEVCYGYDSVGNRAVVAGSNSNCNLAPVAVNDSLATSEDTLKKIDPRGNDSDDLGQPLTITSKTNGQKGSVAITDNGAKLRYTPNANQNGSDSFKYKISDGNSTSAWATVNVTINAVNDPPVAANDLYLDVDNTVWTIFSVRANDTDVEGNTLTVTGLSGVIGQAQIINNGTAVQYQCLSCSGGGEGSFTYTLSDGSATDTALVTVTFSSGGTPLF
jgi:Bacterial Ig domain